MRPSALFVLVTLAVVAFAQAAEARPPFFIRYVNVAETPDGEDVLVADIVNPRNASVLLKAYVRSSSEQSASLNQPEADFAVAPVSMLVGPSSRRKLEFPATDLPERAGKRTFELVIEQQPKYFASRQSLGMPDTMTVTSYIVEIVLPGSDAGGAIEVGNIERQVRQRETE